MKKTGSGLTAGVLVAVVAGLLLGLPAGAGAEDFTGSVRIISSDTPHLQFNQDTVLGHPAQAWTILANEFGLRFEDTTSGLLPLFIQSATGNVGLGTDSPGPDNATQEFKLHLTSTSDRNTFVLAENVNTGVNAAGVLRARSNVASVNFQAHGSGRTIARFGQTLAGWTEFLAVAGNGQIVGTVGAAPLILGTNNANRLHIAATGNIGLGGNAAPDSPIHAASGARLSAGGAWQDASSREYKHDIEDLGAGEALATLEKLTPVKFAYNTDPAERHVGFIAEDVPDLVATRDRKTLSPMEVVAVLTRVMQEQQTTADALRRALDAQSRAIEELRAELAHLRALDDARAGRDRGSLR